MRLILQEPNKTMIEFTNGNQVFFSYLTPIAVKLAETSIFWQVRENKYSTTTSKHTNQICGKGAVRISEDKFAQLLNNITK